MDLIPGLKKTTANSLACTFIAPGIRLANEWAQSNSTRIRMFEPDLNSAFRYSKSACVLDTRRHRPSEGKRDPSAQGGLIHRSQTLPVVNPSLLASFASSAVHHSVNRTGLLLLFGIEPGSVPRGHAADFLFHTDGGLFNVGRPQRAQIIGRL